MVSRGEDMSNTEVMDLSLDQLIRRNGNVRKPNLRNNFPPHPLPPQANSQGNETEYAVWEERRRNSRNFGNRGARNIMRRRDNNNSPMIWQDNQVYHGTPPPPAMAPQDNRQPPPNIRDADHCKMNIRDRKMIISYRDIEIITVHPTGDMTLSAGETKNEGVLKALNSVLSLVDIKIIGKGDSSSNWMIKEGHTLKRFYNGVELEAKGEGLSRCQIIHLAFTHPNAKLATKATISSIKRAKVEGTYCPPPPSSSEILFDPEIPDPESGARCYTNQTYTLTFGYEDEDINETSGSLNTKEPAVTDNLRNQPYHLQTVGKGTVQHSYNNNIEYPINTPIFPPSFAPGFLPGYSQTQRTGFPPESPLVPFTSIPGFRYEGAVRQRGFGQQGLFVKDGMGSDKGNYEGDYAREQRVGGGYGKADPLTRRKIAKGRMFPYRESRFH